MDPYDNEQRYAWMQSGLQGSVGIVTLAIGTLLMHKNCAALI